MGFCGPGVCFVRSLPAGTNPDISAYEFVPAAIIRASFFLGRVEHNWVVFSLIETTRSPVVSLRWIYSNYGLQLRRNYTIHDRSILVPASLGSLLPSGCFCRRKRKYSRRSQWMVPAILVALNNGHSVIVTPGERAGAAQDPSSAKALLITATPLATSWENVAGSLFLCTKRQAIAKRQCSSILAQAYKLGHTLCVRRSQSSSDAFILFWQRFFWKIILHHAFQN